MSLSNLARKSASIPEDAPEGPLEDSIVVSPGASSSTSDAAAETAAAGSDGPARTSVLRRGPVASPSTSIMDEAVDSSFASSIESDMAAAVDSNRPSLDDDAGADTLHAEGQPDAKPSNSEQPDDLNDKPEEDDLEAQFVNAGSGAFLNLTGLAGLGRSHEVLVELLSTAVNREDAVKMALEYNNHLQTSVLPKIEMLNLSAKEREDMIRRAEAEASREATGGGGWLSSLFASMRNPGKKFMRDMDALSADRRRVLEENSGFAERMANRMSSKIKDNYVQTLMEAANAGEALKRGVNSYNAAIFDAPESAELKQAIIDRATATNTTPDAVLRAMVDATDYPDLADQLADLPDTVFQRPDVKVAAEAMAAADADLRDAFHCATQQAEAMQKNVFDADLDLEQMAAQLKKALKAVEDETPRPVDKEKLKEMQERFAAMRAALEANFKAILEKLAANLIPGQPK